MAKLPEHCSGKLSQLLNALALTLRAICIIQVSLGCGVIPAIWTCRLPRWMKNNPTTTLAHKTFHFNRIQCFCVKYFNGFYRCNALYFNILAKHCISMVYV